MESSSMATEAWVWATWQEFEAASPHGGVGAVIDVLRATTVMATALAAGAREIRPVAEVEEARRQAAQDPTLLLAGERGGYPPEGFHLGNSPGEFTPAAVAGRRVVLTTTNGTAALLAAARHGLAPVVVASLVNRAAAAARLRQALSHGGPLHLIASGQKGRLGAEDLLTAGALLDALADRVEPVGDLALLTLAAWRGRAQPLAQLLARTAHGQELVRQGLGADLDACAVLDGLAVAPVFDGEACRLEEGAHRQEVRHQ